MHGEKWNGYWGGKHLNKKWLMGQLIDYSDKYLGIKFES